MWVERLIQHFLSYFSLCPAPLCTLLFFPPSQLIPPCTVLWAYTIYSCKYYHISFFRMVSGLRDSGKKNYRDKRRAQGSTISPHLFTENIILKCQTKRQIQPFSFAWHLPQAHFHNFFCTLNIILTFDSIACKFASQSFRTHHYFRLSTECPSETLSVIPLLFCTVLKEQFEWDLFQTKLEWICLAILTGWKDLCVLGHSFVY